MVRKLRIDTSLSTPGTSRSKPSNALAYSLPMAPAEKQNYRKKDLYRPTQHIIDSKNALRESEGQTELARVLSKYRDRAKERRENERNESNGPEEEIAKLKMSLSNAASGSALFGAPSEAKTKQQLIEESKYLGGDIEHTHLVKGLDVALLNKVRGEMAPQEDSALGNLSHVMAEASAHKHFTRTNDGYDECYPFLGDQELPDIDSIETRGGSGTFDIGEEFGGFSGRRNTNGSYRHGRPTRMSDRSNWKAKNSTKKLDRQWHEINKIIDKRRSGEYNLEGALKKRG